MRQERNWHWKTIEKYCIGEEKMHSVWTAPKAVLTVKVAIIQYKQGIPKEMASKCIQTLLILYCVDSGSTLIF